MNRLQRTQNMGFGESGAKDVPDNCSNSNPEDASNEGEQDKGRNGVHRLVSQLPPSLSY